MCHLILVNGIHVLTSNGAVRQENKTVKQKQLLNMTEKKYTETGILSHFNFWYNKRELRKKAWGFSRLKKHILSLNLIN